MATTTERLELLITAKATDAINGLKNVEGSFGGIAGKMAALDTKMAPLNSKLQSLGLSGVSSGQMMAAGATAAAAAFTGLAVWVGKGIEKQLELADSVRGVMQVSGLSADQASRLVEVTGDYGVSIDTVERAFWKLSSTVQDNRGQLEQHGIKVRENKDGTVDLMGTVENIQRAYMKSGDASERNAILMDAFGKSGKALIPVLEETGSLAEALSQVPESRILSEDDIEKARDYQLAMDDLGDALDALQRSLASTVIPALTDFATTMGTILEGVNTLKDSVPDLGVFGGAMQDAAERSIPGWGQIKGIVGDVNSLFGGGKDDVLTYADAQTELGEATKKVADLSGEGKDKADELREAQKELAAAKAQLEDKTKAVANALQTENEKTRESIQLADQKIGGILGLYSADIQYQGALRDHAEKQETLTRLEAEGMAGTEEFETAKRALEQSDLALVQSGLSLEGQLTKLREEVKAGKVTNEEYQARVDELKAKYPELGEALDRITWKVGEHSGAIERVPNSKHTEFSADVDGAIWQIGRLRSAIDGVKGVFATIGAAAVEAQSGGGRRARGGPTPAGWTGWVGEEGPELVTFSQPAHVFNNRDSMAMAGGGGTNNYQISVAVAPGGNPAEVGRAVVESIKQYERRAGSSWRN